MIISSKARTKGDIVSIKLSNGEELIASWCEARSDVLIIDRPVSLSTGPNGAPALMPFFLTASPDATRDIELNRNLVVMIADTDKPLATQYTSAMSGIIQAPPSPGVIV
jgi:hypothetical protein